ncbi:hypothetical protein PG988_006762 [Apiospora saccharicola]
MLTQETQEEARIPRYPELLRKAETEFTEKKQQEPGPSSHPAHRNLGSSNNLAHPDPGSSAPKLIIMVFVFCLIVSMMPYYWVAGVGPQMELMSRQMELMSRNLEDYLR